MTQQNAEQRRKELAEMPWSDYQLAVRDAVENGTGSIAVNAVAGSGKSTTIEWLILTGAMVGSVLVCAFNKHIADPLKEILAPANQCEVATINAHGNRTVKYHSGRRDWDYLDGRKYMNYIREEMRAATNGHGDVARILSDKWPASAINNVVGLARSTMEARLTAHGRVALSRDSYARLLNNFDISIPSGVDDWAFNCVNRVLQRGFDDWRNVIDFGDQNWLPAMKDLRPRQYDWVVVDEAQDLNAMQLDYVLRCLKPGGRLLAVGDPFQAMYGFSGAMPDSFERIVSASNATELPLSVCYRCPTAHLDEAREIVPHIEASPTAQAGIRGNANWTTLHTNWEEGDQVLCRLNAPLLELAYDQIAKGVGARIRGGDLGKQLIGDVVKISKLHGFRFANFPVFAENYRDEKIAEILRRNGNDPEDMAIQRVRDRHECVMVIRDNAQEARSVDDLKDSINQLFDETNATVLLSSVHKAKGSQANRIFLLQPELMPFWAAEFGPAWQMTQEWNIRYVALTRAKKAMYDIYDDRGTLA